MMNGAGDGGPDLVPDLASGDDSTGSSGTPSEEQDMTWIEWFVSIRGNDLFCEVDEDFLRDEFNLSGLQAEVQYYEYALDTVLDAEPPPGEVLTEEQQETIDAAAEQLYGLAHARYILTAKGLAAMAEKLRAGAFGACDRVHCERSPVLPVGRSDTKHVATVCFYCPRCNDIYLPRSRRHASE